MSSQCTVVTAHLTLQQLVDGHVLASGQRCFFVNRGGDTIGLIALHQVREVPSSEWATTSAAEVMVRLEQSRAIDPDTELCAALEEMDRDGVDLLPVTRDQQVIGMLSREDVINVLRNPEELGT
jgi:predicted transcriptional regulator